MRVKAIRAFNDLEAGCRRERGSEFDVADGRGEHLVSLGLAKAVEQVEQPKKQATRRRAAKAKPKE